MIIDLIVFSSVMAIGVGPVVRPVGKALRRLARHRPISDLSQDPRGIIGLVRNSPADDQALFTWALIRLTLSVCAAIVAVLIWKLALVALIAYGAWLALRPRKRSLNRSSPRITLPRRSQEGG